MRDVCLGLCVFFWWVCTFVEEGLEVRLHVRVQSNGVHQVVGEFIVDDVLLIQVFLFFLVVLLQDGLDR